MTFTTHFELHSQTTRLVEDNLDIWRNIRPGTGFSPSMLSCSKEPRPAPSNKFVSPNYNSGTKRHRISNLSFCHFTRSYWGNPGWFLFLRLLICLSSAGSLTRFEVKGSRGRGSFPRREAHARTLSRRKVRTVRSRSQRWQSQKPRHGNILSHVEDQQRGPC